MESLEEILTCKICMERLNDTERKPLFLLCGHSFCQKCLRFVYKKPLLSCPLDKTIHRFETFDKIPTNFSVLNAIHSTLQNKDANNLVRNEKKCEKHQREVLKFYCVSDETVICQECLLEEHLGPGHEIISAEKILRKGIFKRDIEQCLEKLDSQDQMLEEAQSTLLESMQFQKESMTNTIQAMIAEINNQLEQCLTNYDKAVVSIKEKVLQDASKLAQYREKVLAIKKTLEEANEYSEQMVLDAKSIINEVLNYQTDLKSEEMDIDDCIYLDKQLTKHIYLDSRNTPDPQLRALLMQFKTRDIINQDVYDLMVKVDRKNFVKEEHTSMAYQDIPRSIGWGTTISAPHMHAMTLQKLHTKFVQGGTALDIGTGSGYIAACFAEAMGKDCKVYMVDHIQEILDFAIKNIKKGHPYLLKQKRIIPILQDGMKGLPEHGPYDIIHVGGAISEVSQVLLDQLKLGGMLWAPVGGSFCQDICVITKELDGTISTSKIMEVRYGSLSTVDDQLRDF